MNYNKIFQVILFLLSINIFALEAQDNRSTQTIVADVLSQIPAKNQADYNKQIGDLTSTGEEGILILARMLNASGQGSNAKVEYALSELANYVSGLNDEQVKQTTINAFQKAITATNVPEIRDFLQTRLQTLGVGYKSAAAAEEILTNVTKNSPVHLRIAAFQEDIKKSNGKEKEVAKKVLEALKDSSTEYRNAALNFASPYAGNEVYIELAKAARKAKPDVQIEILDWFGRESKLPEKTELIKNLEISYDLTFNQFLIKLFNEKNPDVKKAVAWTMVKIGDASFIPLLADLLTKSDSQMIRLGKETLMSFKGDVPSAVVQIVNKASDEGKIAAIEILASRRASSHINTIFELTKSSSPEVKNTAYSALKDVAEERDFTRLCGMLETADAETIKPLQQAVIASLSSFPQKEQLPTVYGRMLQAGESMRYLYYTVLASTGDKEALPEIIKGFKQSDSKKKDAAFEALLTWKGKEAAEQLLDIASDKSESTAYTDRALSRYVELVSNPSITPENRLLSLRKAMEASLTDEQRMKILQHLEDMSDEEGFVAIFNGKDLKRPEPFTLSPEEKKEGFKILFDGTNMYEWTGNTVDYILQDGTITLVPSEGSGGNLYTKNEYDNFIIRFDFMLTPGANNGLGIRTPMEGDAAYVGMELQILDNEDPIYKDLESWQYHGSVYGVIPAKRGFLKPVGEWNTEEVIANGDQIKITLNGEVILDGNIREATKNGTIDGKEHPGLFNRKGHIGFLGHGSEVKFRNIRIKELK